VHDQVEPGGPRLLADLHESRIESRSSRLGRSQVPDLGRRGSHLDHLPNALRRLLGRVHGQEGVQLVVRHQRRPGRMRDQRPRGPHVCRARVVLRNRGQLGRPRVPAHVVDRRDPATEIRPVPALGVIAVVAGGLQVGIQVGGLETIGPAVDPPRLAEVHVGVHQARGDVHTRHVHPRRTLRDRAIGRRTDTGQPISFHDDDPLRDPGCAGPVDHGGADEGGRLGHARAGEAQPEQGWREKNHREGELASGHEVSSGS
jgi:hypothetical protein